MNTVKRTCVVGLVSISVLTGCVSGQSDGQKVGTVVGVVGGALLGSQFGSGAGKIIGTLAGAAIGGYLGNKIGEMLDPKEKEAVSNKSNEALSSARDGETVTWTNPDSGAEAKITPNNTKAVSRNVPILRKKAVQAPPSLDLLGETYEAAKNVNLRAGPSTKMKILGGLKKGERFQAIGRVTNAKWIMVGQNNRSVGYVYAPLVRKSEARQVAAVPSNVIDLDSAPITDQRLAIGPAMDLDSMMKDKAIDMDAEGLVAETVSVKQQCRTLDVAIEKKGEQANQTLKACKGPNGAWGII